MTQYKSYLRKITSIAEIRMAIPWYWKQVIRFVPRSIGRWREHRIAGRTPKKHYKFCIVSCQRNAGEAILKCLDSVFAQDYPRDHVRHIVVDDASTDNTDSLIRRWMSEHPGHSVDYWHNETRRGGCDNQLRGFKSIEPNWIAAELNGDDWLPDPFVLRLLNGLYQDPDLWMTYNTFAFWPSGDRPLRDPIPQSIIRLNRFRDHPWVASALHTFRIELFHHVEENTMIDPATGRYWESADDVALYLTMLELAGFHARHIYSTTYVYNLRDQSEQSKDQSGQLDRARRIREQKRYQPLNHLGNSAPK